MRLGSFPCIIKPGTLAHKVYQTLSVTERHRHRFEFNPLYRARMEEHGFIVSATSPDESLAEIVELRDHPFMIATQSHPELTSRPHSPHPLFIGFIEALITRSVTKASL